MRRQILFLAVALGAFAQKRPVTLEALASISAMDPADAQGNPLSWSADGTAFVARQGTKLIVYDANTRSARTLLDTAEIDKAAREKASASTGKQPFDWENRRVTESVVQWARLGDRLLYVASGELYLISTLDGAAEKVPVDGNVHDAKWSPDGQTIAYRRAWDLYTVEGRAPFKERRLTKDGSDLIRNGGLDWVYPEELDLGTAYWWAPDSKSIAYLRFDVSDEPLYPHADLRSARALAESQHYPQAGERNPVVQLGVVAAAGGGTKWFDVGDTVREYLVARVTWSPDANKLYVVRPNRVQNKQELLAYDVRSRKSALILSESDPFWVNLNGEPVFLKGGAEFLWLSEASGFRHIYRYTAQGGILGQLTRGEWEVTAIGGVDEAAGIVYYTSSEASPLERQVYAVGLNGQGKRQLSSGAGTHAIQLGPFARFYLDTYSALAVPPRTTLHAGDGRQVGVYREADLRVVDRYEILPTELASFRGEDGTLFYSRMIRPAGFDSSKKYPAVVLVYGGPGAQGVRDSWLGADFDQVLAHAGFVVWQVDNRGSAGRGHAFETPVFQRLGILELDDQVAGVRRLLSMGFVDAARVGVRGWSYGGFMTLNSMLNAADVFRAGAAGAPVTDWRNYDTIYTERYMHLPDPDGIKGYEETALPQYAAKLKGSLLILHNYEDDNVLFQHTLRMINALERAGKQFELALYTQKTHHVTGPEAQHVNAAMLAFFERHLK
jgi:dipeptidyl-peptidase-4